MNPVESSNCCVKLDDGSCFAFVGVELVIDLLVEVTFFSGDECFAGVVNFTFFCGGAFFAGVVALAGEAFFATLPVCI